MRTLRMFPISTRAGTREGFLEGFLWTFYCLLGNWRVALAKWSQAGSLGR